MTDFYERREYIRFFSYTRHAEPQWVNSIQPNEFNSLSSPVVAGMASPKYAMMED